MDYDFEDDFSFESKERKLTILIVEDNDADLFLLKKNLLILWPDHLSISAKSLHEASEACKKNNIDLIFLDLNLPDSYGPSSVQEIRKLNKSVPIIVLTGLGSDLTLKEAIRLGASKTFLKSQMSDPSFYKTLLNSL